MKKGFSLIELLAVIILLGIIITLASLAVTTYKKNSEDSLKEQRSVFPCLQTIRLLARGNYSEAQNVFLKIQEDSLEQYLNEQYIERHKKRF